MNILKLIFLLTISLPAFAQEKKVPQNKKNFMNQHVNAIDENYSYKDDIDDSRFRLKVYKSSAKKIAAAMNKNRSNLCLTATSGKKFDFSNSSNYVVSVLKAAGAIDPEDKNYKFKSAHFIWEQYLTYRKFVDVSRAFRRIDANKLFEKLPDGYVVLVEKQCVPNGAVAIKCKKGLYTKRFPNFTKLKERLNDKAFPKCKIGKGLKIIVEADRLIGSI